MKTDKGILEVNEFDFQHIKEACDIIKDLSASILQININSSGGDISSAFMLLDYMEDFKIRNPQSQIWTTTASNALSSGAFILIAGDYRIMSPRSLIMLHDLQCGLNGQLSYELAMDTVRYWEKARIQFVKDLQRFTKLEEKEILKLITYKDRFFDAQEALEFGLIDEIRVPD